MERDVNYYFMEDAGPEVNQYLEREFSTENFRAYAEACRDTAWKMVEMMMDRGGKPITVLIPSRGAVPFIIGAIKAIKEDEEINSFVRDAFGTDDIIDLPPLSCFDQLKDRGGKSSAQEKLVRILILPFTADASFSGAENRNVVSGMRRFMTRVSNDILFRPPKRRNSEEFKMYLDFLKEVEGRKGLASFYESFKPVEKGEPVLYIDTVISGRASHTIMKEFEDLGVRMGYTSSDQVVPLLVVDEYGKSLKDNFRKYIDRFSATKSVVKVPQILSEDRGAALLGVCAIIYENLITNAVERHMCGELAPCFGSWHDVPTNEAERYNKLFQQFINLIGQKITGSDDHFEEDRNSFIRQIKSEGVLNPSPNLDYSEVAEFFRAGLPFEKARETGSHIVQIKFDNDGANKILDNICKNG